MIENAKKFFEELDGNEKAKALLKAASADNHEPDVAALADAARQSGYDVTDDEVRTLLAGMEQRTAAASDAVAGQLRELSNDELELAAAGKDHMECEDTYKDGENCFNTDVCDKFSNFYVAIGDKKTCSSNTYCSGFMLRPDCSATTINL